MTAVAPTSSNVQTALRAFLLSALPQFSAGQIVAGQANRVAEPQFSDFVVFWPLRRDRIETNVDSYADVAFTASIAGTTMTVSALRLGTIGSGATLFGTGVAVNSTITNQLTGTPGGTGTYLVAPSQTSPSQTMSCGAESFLQPVDAVFQLDVHGPGSSDNAQIITTLFRDQFGVDAFAAALDGGGNPIVGVTPLHADDPKQIPFINAEQQWETRWVVEAHMQANQAVLLPLQFADAANVSLIEIP
jgi:hypothetical protein